ncbi:MAG TPA: hypothetical protein PKD00_09490, partial [Burkholderiales bacterium]|nr:hypothetical protein [Burkholderiales bacterium]
EVDKADAAKDALYGQLASVDVHETFVDDYQQFMDNIFTKVDELDNTYQGKMIDRTYKNELNKLIKSTQNNSDLRYMVNTTKQLRTYEKAKVEKGDYLDYNDLNKSKYDEVLNRAKGSKPLFIMDKIYDDAKPENEINVLASSVGITESTVIDVQRDANGNPTGSIHLTDKKTRLSSDITNKLVPMMEEFKGTSAGQQLQRKAAAEGISYEEAFIGQVNAAGSLLEIDSFKKSIVEDPEAAYKQRQQQIELQRDEYETRTALSLLQIDEERARFQKQMEVQEKSVQLELMSLRQRYIAMGIQDAQFTAEFNQRAEQFGMNKAIELMSKQLDMESKIYAPSSKNTGAGGGGSGGNINRFSGGNMKTIPPGTTAADVSTFAHRAERKAAFEAASEQAKKLDATINFTPTGVGSNMSVSHQIEMYAQAPSEEAKERIGKMPINIDGKQTTIAAAINEDQEMHAYYNTVVNNVATARVSDKIDYDATQNFIGLIGGANGQNATDLVKRGIITRGDASRAAEYQDGWFIDEDALLEHFGVKDQLEKDRATEVAYRSIHPVNPRSAALGATTFTYNELHAISTGAVTSKLLTKEKAIQAMKDYDSAKIEEYSKSNAMFGKWMQASNKALTDYSGGLGVNYKGYGLNVGAGDNRAKIETAYEQSVNVGKNGLTITTDKGARVMPVENNKLSVINGEGKAVGNTYSYIRPDYVTIDPKGELMVIGRMFTIDPKNVKQGDPVPDSVQITYRESPENIKGAFLTPMFIDAHGDSVGTFVSQVFPDNAKWIATNMRIGDSTKKITKNYAYAPDINVTKEVNGTYTIQSKSNPSQSRGGITSEFELAEILSLAQYKNTTSAP